MPNVADMITKQFVAKTEVDIDERTVTAVISTSSVDRDREIVLAKGANLEAYVKNPVVLWAHDYKDMPVGRALWIKKGRDKITAKVKFATVEQNPNAEYVYQLFKGGFLNAFSIGFSVSKSHSPTPDEVKKKPEFAEAVRIIDEWELLEFSVVPVPANSEALSQAVKSKELILSGQIVKDMEIDLGGEDINEIFIPDTEVTESKGVYCDRCHAEIKGVNKEFPVSLVVEPIEIIEVKSLPIEVSEYIDVQSVIDEELKLKKGIMY